MLILRHNLKHQFINLRWFLKTTKYFRSTFITKPHTLQVHSMHYTHIVFFYKMLVDSKRGFWYHHFFGKFSSSSWFMQPRCARSTTTRYPPWFPTLMWLIFYFNHIKVPTLIFNPSMVKLNLTYTCIKNCF